jgi:hypothetical protein
VAAVVTTAYYRLLIRLTSTLKIIPVNMLSMPMVINNIDINAVPIANADEA